MSILNKKKMYQVRINRVQDYIDKNLNSEFNLETIAKISTFSNYHFHRIFKTITGETLYKYITRIRCEKACKMLKHDKQKRIIDIAYNCGFGSSAVFSKIFKKLYDVTPSQWRETNSSKAATHSDTDYFSLLYKKSNDSIFYKESMKKNGLLAYKIEDIPGYHIIYKRETGLYTDARNLAWKPLIRWSMAHNVLTERTVRLGILHDNPYITPPEKCRYDAGLVLPEQDISSSALLNTRKIHAGKYIVYTYKITLHSLNNIWEDIFSLNLSESGYQIRAKPIIERYTKIFNKINTNQDTIDICIPIKPI